MNETLTNPPRIALRTYHVHICYSQYIRYFEIEENTQVVFALAIYSY